MVFLSQPVKRMMLEATLADLEILRNNYRHVLPPSDLKFIDSLIASKQSQPVSNNS